MSGRTPHAGDDPHADEELVTAGTPVADAEAAVVLVHGRGATARSIVGFGKEVAGAGDVALSSAASPPAVRETEGLSLLALSGRSEARATASASLFEHYSASPNTSRGFSYTTVRMSSTSIP